MPASITNFTEEGIDLADKYLAKADASLIPAKGLWAWGGNGGGQLGLGDIVSRSSPVQVGSLTNWSQVESGYSAVAIKSDGTLWAWGGNFSGQLGLGDRTSRSSPVQVGSLTNWRSVSAFSHVLAITTNGALWAWGYNGNGRLGLGDIVHRSSPVQVGSLTNWSQVACGYHTLAVKTDGTLWAWGRNNYGQLGLGDRTHRSSPVQVGSLTDWRQVAASAGHSLAVKTDGTLWAWGYNRTDARQLGLLDAVHRSSPTQVGSLTNWRQVAAGFGSASLNSSFAIKTDGTLWAWGYNGNFGQLGLGDRINRSSPVQVGSLTNWSQISTKSRGVLAVKTDGTLWGWGYNDIGNLGLNDRTRRSSPVQVGSLTGWRQVSASTSPLALFK